jgi:hypothetical protein
MSARSCPHCGAARTDRPACPVCDLPYERESEPASPTREPVRASTSEPEPASPTFWGGLWDSGRLALVLAALALGAGSALPLAWLTRRLVPGATATPITLAEMGLQLGPLAREVRALTALAAPFSAVVMVQFLFSRTTGRAMRASRPMLYALSLLPVVSLGTAWLRLRRGDRFSLTPGPAAALVLLGALLGVFAGTRFGRGVPETRERSRRRDEDEDDEDHEDRR